MTSSPLQRQYAHDGESGVKEGALKGGCALPLRGRWLGARRARPTERGQGACALHAGTRHHSISIKQFSVRADINPTTSQNAEMSK